MDGMAGGQAAMTDIARHAAVPINEERLAIWTWRPGATPARGLLFLFDGRDRDARRLLRKALPAAERLGLALVAPEMPRERFPTWRYDRAGIVRNRVIQPRSEWTGALLDPLLAWTRATLALDDAPALWFGHSAGGQFLSRAAAFRPPSEAAAIIVSNPSVHAAPTLAEPAPWGFGGVFDEDEAAERLRAYLGAPLVIYLGGRDTSENRLVMGQAAQRQGANRVERGRNVFALGAAAAARLGCPFNWRLVVAAEIGHSSRQMLASPAFDHVLGF